MTPPPHGVMSLLHRVIFEEEKLPSVDVDDQVGDERDYVSGLEKAIFAHLPRLPFSLTASERLLDSSCLKSSSMSSQLILVMVVDPTLRMSQPANLQPPVQLAYHNLSGGKQLGKEPKG